MKDVRLSLDCVFLVFYTIVDCSVETCSKEYFFPDIVFIYRDDAYQYVNQANERYQNRVYHCVELPIYPKL